MSEPMVRPTRVVGWTLFLLGVFAVPEAARAASATAVLRIYVARHGQTDWNFERRLQGRNNTALNEAGRAQARELARLLDGVPIDRVYSSSLRRSRETAEIARGETPLESLAGLDEQDIGRFQGVCADDSDTQLAVEFEQRSQDPEDALDGGESVRDHETRVAAAVAEIVRRHPAGTLLLVGHGGTNRWVMRTLLGLSFEQAGAIRQANDEVFLIELRVGVPPAWWRRMSVADLSRPRSSR